MLAPLALIAAAVSVLVAYIRRRVQHRPAHAMIVSPRQSTVVAGDGKVRSVQTAVLTLDPADLDRIWGPANLENLARTYWRFLSRVTLGLVRVIYSADTRSVVLVSAPLTLLRFGAPEYTLAPDRGTVRWLIRDGLLVARSGRGSGFLSLDVKREPDDDQGRARLRIEVEVSAFYPSIAVGFGVPMYKMTQSVIHGLVTNAFLRSLTRLRLDRSKIGLLSQL